MEVEVPEEKQSRTTRNGVLTTFLIAAVAGGGGSTGVNLFYQDSNQVTRDNVTKWLDNALKPIRTAQAQTDVRSELNSQELARRESTARDGRRAHEATIRIDAEIEAINGKIGNLEDGQEKLEDGQEALRDGQTEILRRLPQ